MSNPENEVPLSIGSNQSVHTCLFALRVCSEIGEKVASLVFALGVCLVLVTFLQFVLGAHLQIKTTSMYFHDPALCFAHTRVLILRSDGMH